MSVLSLCALADRHDPACDLGGLFAGHDHQDQPEPSRQAFRAMELLRHWEGLRTGAGAVTPACTRRRIPHMKHIDPITLWPWLGDLLVADHIRDRRDLRFTLIGTNIVEQFGVNYTGRLHSELVADFGYPEVFDGYWKAIDSREPGYDLDRFLTHNARYSGYDVHRVMLPYGDDSGEVARLVVYYGIERTLHPRI